MNRRGRNQDDSPQSIQHARLLNIIGFALSVSFSDPSVWSEYEKVRAAKGELCFFKGDSLEAINIVAAKILSECGDDRQVCITVVPVEFLYLEKFYSLAIFRFKRYEESSWKFVDNIGRLYSSFEDWKENNKLPPGRVLYPLICDISGNVTTSFCDTPSVNPMNTRAMINIPETIVLAAAARDRYDPVGHSESMLALSLNAGEGSLVSAIGYQISLVQPTQYIEELMRIMRPMSLQVFKLSSDEFSSFINLRSIYYKNDKRLLQWIDGINNTRSGNTVRLLLDVQAKN